MQYLVAWVFVNPPPASERRLIRKAQMSSDQRGKMKLAKTNCLCFFFLYDLLAKEKTEGRSLGG